MVTRKEALKLIRKYIKTENTIKHMLATEAIMGALARRLEPEKENLWAMAGLLHDLDYEMVEPNEHGKKTVQILKEQKLGLSPSVYQTITAHNYDCLGPEYKPQNLMDWSLFICDSLTGLIVATTLVRPEKKLALVPVKSVMKKFKDKAFARGTRREDVALCEEKLDIPLQEFVEIGLKAMQEISDNLGL